MTRPQTPNPIQRADMRRRKTLPKRMALAGAVTAACLSMGLAAAQETAVRGRMLDQATADPRAVDIDGARRLPRSSERELPKATFVLGDAVEPRDGDGRRGRIARRTQQRQHAALRFRRRRPAARRPRAARPHRRPGEGP